MKTASTQSYLQSDNVIQRWQVPLSVLLEAVLKKSQKQRWRRGDLTYLETTWEAPCRGDEKCEKG